MRMRCLFVFLVATGCKDTASDDTGGPVDDDGDGFTVEDGDCDDADASIHPGAEDTWYDGVDTNCDEASDYDADGDGHDSDDYDGDDCDDADATISPSADEIWDDGIDQDCDGLADVEGSSCSADFTVTFPDGSTTTLDGCTDWDFDASFEYDPDDPPEVIDFTFTLGATTEADFDCRVELVQQGVCGEGYYDQRDATTSTTLVLLDCSGVADEYEGTFSASEGYLRIDTLDAGSDAGSFAGEPLATTLEAHLHVWTAGGIDLEGDLALTLKQVASDGEEQPECAVTDGDEDGDGHVAETYFDGDDCDDEDVTVHPGAVDEAASDECMLDGDSDGYGDADPPDGFDAGTDCDDDDATTFPGAAESEDASACMTDADADGYGDNDPADGVDAGTDCDDDEVTVYPGAVDEAASDECMLDGDSDGYGDADPPDGFDAGTDCDDDADRAYPYDSNGDGVEDACGWRVDAGGRHTCALDSAGSIVCWGWDNHDQVSDTPTGSGYTAVSGGGYHTCAIDSTGSIACWGYDDDGQVSDAPTGSGYTAVSAGSGSSDPAGGGYGVGRHTCALDSAGSIACWGYDDEGQVSDAPTGTGYTAVSAGYYHTCALDSGGAIECWGHDYHDQVSDTPTGSGYTAVSAGDRHTCALDSAGSIECWGQDWVWQISDAPTGSGYTAVSAGNRHTCALDSAGSIECWGWDDGGQVSDAPTGSGYTAVSAGGEHTCAIGSSGGIKCWGSDSKGQCSDIP